MRHAMLHREGSYINAAAYSCAADLLPLFLVLLLIVVSIPTCEFWYYHANTRFRSIQ
jgi:hypothetical protein